MSDLDLTTVRDWLVITGVVAIGVGYLIGNLRKGNADAQAETIAAQSVRIDVLTTELNEERTARVSAESECRSEIARLEGRLSSSEEDRRQLRELVMLQTVPAPLSEAMNAVAQGSANAIVTALEGRLAELETRLLGRINANTGRLAELETLERTDAG